MNCIRSGAGRIDDSKASKSCQVCMAGLPPGARTATVAGMPTGSLTLSEHPGATVQLTCGKCDRQGRYKKSTLVEKYGGNVALPDMLRLIAADCPKKATLGNDLCGVHYVGL